MLLDQPERLLTWMLLALLLDAIIGDPPWLWKRFPHPVVLIGRAVSALEHVLYCDALSPSRMRRRGTVLVLIVVALALSAGLAVHVLAQAIPYGWLIEALLGGILLAQRSLFDHVLAVAQGLDCGIEPGRRAVSMIVGRDPDSLDQHAVGRAAIESTAENFSDGVIAPLFWGLVLGLPGILAYKAINTMDSMIGHKSQRYLDFGRTAALLDDVVNLPASRLSALLVWIAAALLPGTDVRQSWTAVWQDAAKHRSPNAGWPEAAFAGALGIRLCGPRTYDGVPAAGDWIGRGRPDVTPTDIRRSLELLWVAWGVGVAAVAAIWWAVAR